MIAPPPPPSMHGKQRSRNTCVKFCRRTLRIASSPLSTE